MRTKKEEQALDTVKEEKRQWKKLLYYMLIKRKKIRMELKQVDFVYAHGKI